MSHTAWELDGSFAIAGFFQNGIGKWSGYCGNTYFGIDDGMTFEEMREYVLQKSINHYEKAIDEITKIREESK